MKEITTYTENNQTVISARDLSNELGLRNDNFSHWFKTQTSLFVENEEFGLLVVKDELQPVGYSGMTQKKDYWLTLDTAKHIALMSRTEKGKEYRTRLIQLEKENTKPMTKRELAKHNYELIMIAEDAIDAKIEMEKQCLLKLAKIGNHLAGSTISEIGDNVTFNTAAKLVSTNLGIDLGHNSLMKLCRDNGWLMTGKRSPSEKNMPTQCKIQYFKIKLFFNEDTGKYSITPVITPLGLIKMVKLIPNWYVQGGKLIQF